MAILRYLLKHGARPVVSDENQLTPLMLAGGVTQNAHQENKLTVAFQLTASRGLPTCVQLLLAEAGDFWRGSAMANLRFEINCFTFLSISFSTQS